MKLIEARIDGYGELNDRSIGLDAPVIVVYGPNEAGKSTLFGFLRMMLYGFARRSSKADRHEPARGGRHGGRLLFADAEARIHMVERYAAVAGGKPKVRLWQTEQSGSSEDGGLDTGRQMEQAVWEQLYLGGVQERLYRQLYAITLTELMEVGTLSGGELSRYLYQAGWEEGRAVEAAEKRIQSEMDELFKPRGSSPRLNGLAAKIDVIDGELRGLQDGIERFNELTREGEEAERELSALEKALPAAEERVRLLLKAVSARPLWLRAMGLRAEAERLQYASKLPMEAAAAWESLTARRGELREASDRLIKELEQRKTRQAALTFDEPLIAKGGEIEAVLQSAERMRSLASMSLEWQAELAALDETIAKLVAGISPEWTERQLRELIVTVGDKDDVRAMRERFAAMQRQAEKLQAECDTLQSQLQEALILREETASALRLEGADKPSAGADTSYSLRELSSSELAGAWTAVDDALRSWELEQARASAERNEGVGASRGAAGNSNRSYWFIGGVSGIGAAALLAIGSEAGWLGGLSDGAMAASLVLGGASAVLLVAGAVTTIATGSRRDAGSQGGGSGRRRSGYRAPSAVNEDGAEERIEKALALLVRDPAASLSRLIDRTSGNVRSGARAALQSQVGARQERLTRQERLNTRLTEQDQRISRIHGMLAEREQALAVLAGEERETTAAWGDWLSARMLPRNLSPAAALETFELAESAMERMRQYDRLAAKIAAADKERAEYASRAARLCEGSEEGLRRVNEDPTLALTLLQAEQRRHAAAQAEYAALATGSAELSASLAQAEEELSAIEETIRRLMDDAGAANEAAYAEALKDRMRLNELEGELSRLNIELAAGQTEERLAELEKLWINCDELVLQQSLQDAELNAAKLAEEQREWLERRGRVKQAAEHLMNEEKRSRLLAEREMAVAALESDADRYAVLAVSRSLIRTTRRKFEEERQPAVLRNAAAYMKQLSEGRYVRVHANGREAGIMIERSDGVVLDSGLLSRGTAEQLYLSMRLALAREAAGPVKLPMLLDDLFVNFDRTRLQAAAELMNRLAEDRQLILFTCHEHVRDALLAGCAQAKLVDMTPQRA